MSEENPNPNPNPTSSPPSFTSDICTVTSNLQLIKFFDPRSFAMLRGKIYVVRNIGGRFYGYTKGESCAAYRYNKPDFTSFLEHFVLTNVADGTELKIWFDEYTHNEKLNKYSLYTDPESISDIVKGIIFVEQEPPPQSFGDRVLSAINPVKFGPYEVTSRGGGKRKSHNTKKKRGKKSKKSKTFHKK